MARKKITQATVLILFTALVIHGLNPEPADSQKTGPAGVQELSAGMLRFDFGGTQSGFRKSGTRG